MPSLEVFRVEFDRPSATYLGGEIVTGNIFLQVCKPKIIRGLYLIATGRADVGWQEMETTTNAQGKTESHPRTYNDSEKYFNFEFSLLGAKKSDVKIEIPAGHHRYPFKFHLPRNIPCSFEHGYGYVRYTVKSVIDRPWRFNHECKAAFTVLSMLDLNAYQQKCLGIDDEVNKKFSCLCVIDQGSLHVCIKVPSSGYVPGQTVYTTIDYKNSSNSVRITKIETKYEQKLNFYVSGRTKSTICVMVSSTNSGPFAPKGQIVSGLLIPPLPPSYLEFCKIIDVEYILRVIVHVSGWHKAINKEYPMITGTLPLYPPPTATPLDNLKDTSTFEQTMGEPAMLHIPIPQPSAPFLPNNQPASRDAPDAIQSTSFVYPNQPSSSTVNWQIPPPSYEECMSGAPHIKDNDESNYVYGANDPFAPRYPVFNYPSPSIDKD